MGNLLTMDDARKLVKDHVAKKVRPILEELHFLRYFWFNCNLGYSDVLHCDNLIKDYEKSTGKKVPGRYRKGMDYWNSLE